MLRPNTEGAEDSIRRGYSGSATAAEGAEEVTEMHSLVSVDTTLKVMDYVCSASVIYAVFWLFFSLRYDPFSEACTCTYLTNIIVVLWSLQALCCLHCNPHAVFVFMCSKFLCYVMG